MKLEISAEEEKLKEEFNKEFKEKFTKLVSAASIEPHQECLETSWRDKLRNIPLNELQQFKELTEGPVFRKYVSFLKEKVEPYLSLLEYLEDDIGECF